MKGPNKKVLIATGGTGGHVYPAMALFDDLRGQLDDCLIAGFRLSSNRFFDQTRYPYKEISSGAGIKQTFSILKGVQEACSLLSSFKPNLVVGFGSYHTFPLLLAATIKRVPFVLHAADTYPGKVIRWFSPYAQAVGVHFPESQKWIHGKTIEVHIPLRKGYQKGFVTKEEALRHFGLTPELPTVLVFGGSQGAQYLNKVVGEALPHFSFSLQFIHLTGSEEAQKELALKYQKQRCPHFIAPFEKRMDLAWAAADIAFCRSGAVSCAELLEFEKPALLIPYPHAMDNHQETNAQKMVEMGLALKRLEGELAPKELDTLFYDLLQTKEEREFRAEQHKRLHSQKSLKDLVMAYI